jgi:predicted GTPase
MKRQERRVNKAARALFTIFQWDEDEPKDWDDADEAETTAVVDMAEALVDLADALINDVGDGS